MSLLATALFPDQRGPSMSERKSEHYSAREQASMAVARWDNEGGAAAHNPREDEIVQPKPSTSAQPRKKKPQRTATTA